MVVRSFLPPMTRSNLPLASSRNWSVTAVSRIWQPRWLGALRRPRPRRRDFVATGRGGGLSRRDRSFGSGGAGGARSRLQRLSALPVVRWMPLVGGSAPERSAACSAMPRAGRAAASLRPASPVGVAGRRCRGFAAGSASACRGRRCARRRRRHGVHGQAGFRFGKRADWRREQKCDSSRGEKPIETDAGHCEILQC